MTDIVDDLVSFGAGNINVLGKELSKSYIKRCLVLWEEKYGPAVAAECRVKLLKIWEKAE